ncbi:MAG: hypothetical protein CMK42_01905 [Porticoccaceae bacterium]|nr:hypothetical protein [Porticoccaceae bacterium]
MSKECKKQPYIPRRLTFTKKFLIADGKLNPNHQNHLKFVMMDHQLKFGVKEMAIKIWVNSCNGGKKNDSIKCMLDD